MIAEELSAHVLVSVDRLQKIEIHLLLFAYQRVHEND